jgi:imidazolonepropionase-like amidohydrolase
MRPKSCFLVALLALAPLVLPRPAAAAANAEEPEAAFAVRGATIHPVSGAPVTGASLVVEGGRVKEIRSDGSVPDGMAVVEANGKVITPGFVDASAALGLGQEERREGSPELSVLDGFDTYDEEALSLVRATGTTAIAIEPLSRGAFAGKGALLRLVPGVGHDEMTLSPAAFERGSLGTISQGRTTSLQRLEDYYSMQRTLAGAKEYIEQWDRYREDLAEYEKKKKEYDEKKARGEITPSSTPEPRTESGGEPPPSGEERRPGGRRGGRPPGGGGGGGGERRGGGGAGGEERRPPSDAARGPAASEEKKDEPPKKPAKPATDPARETLAQVVKGELPLFLECHRANDIRSALRLAEEFSSVKLVLVGATEAVSVADEIRARGVAAIVGPVFLPFQRDLARLSHDASLASKLHAAGVAVAISSGGLSPAGSRYLNLQAAAAAAEGLPRDAALAAITLRAAEALGVADRIGSLSPGREADFLIWDRDPIDARARLEAVYVGGRRVSDDEMKRRG